MIGTPEPVRRGAKSTPLAPVDIAWLRMDEPANLMHVHGVLVLDGHVEREKVAAVLGARFAEIPRFHQRVALDGGRLVWTEDEAFDIDRHVPEESLSEPGGDAELAAAIGAHLDRPFDRAHPLWEFRLLHGYRGSDTVVFGRLHHAIGDGVALMVVLLAMTDLSPEGPAAVGSGELAAAARSGNPFFDLFTAGPGAALEAAHAAAERWMPETLRLMLGPLEALRKAHPLVRGLGSTAALGRMLARPSDPRSPFKGDLGTEKRVAWTRAAPLDEVKSLAKSLGGTINDVLNSAMAGGLRRYLLRHGTPPDDLSFRAAMPVNLRPLEEMAALGNRFGLIFLSLPVGMADPVRRLEEMKARARALRHSAEPLVVLGLLGFAGRSPLAIQEVLMKIFGSKATAVFTNVPGPRKTVWFAGRPIRDIFFWVPQAGRLGLGVSIFSYAGQVRMGVGTDAGLVPDPGRIVDGFDAELEALADAAARS
ncbi:MAG TPA: wax ester/triacylglycerol synthase family O-acyltransferase [Thermoanaerobaculia bacterium]|nr:wax ester/triacylglycerol synthase family O-acyltransferase [Thermoanaerobaculia bacterium]